MTKKNKKPIWRRIKILIKDVFIGEEHKCEWDYDNHVNEEMGGYYPCKHHGCKSVSIKDKDGKWLDPALLKYEGN